MDFKTGGQQVILRLVEAYGFSTRQMLCDHLGVSKSTLATRFMRDIFPAEWVIQCALETNVSLEWLCTGEGNSNRNNVQDIVRIPTSKISDGKLIDSSFFFYDKAMLSTSIRKPHIYISDTSYFIAEKNYTEVVDGQWVINIDGMVTLKTLLRLPNKKIRLEGGSSAIECSIEEIDIIAKITQAIYSV